MSDWNLIRWLLNFDFLVANEPGVLDLQDQLTFHHIFDAFLTWALDHWSESFAAYCLVDFESAGITCVNSDLYAWLHVTASGDNTFDSNHASN